MLIHHIGVSGGKDSSALLIWAVHESGLPRESIWPTFCNTHNEDPVTYAHLKLLSDKVCVANGVRPIEWLEPNWDYLRNDSKVQSILKDNPDLKDQAFFLLAARKRRFPARRSQFCTDFLKLRPTQKWIKDRMADGHTIVALSGVRADESFARSKLPEREFSDMFCCESWRPLLRWTWPMVVDLHTKHGIPMNPLYAMGAKRVGCFPCVNCGKREIRLVAKFRPEKIDEIRRWEIMAGKARDHFPFTSFFHAKTVTKNFRRTYIATNLPSKRFYCEACDKDVDESDVLVTPPTNLKKKPTMTHDEQRGGCGGKVDLETNVKEYCTIDDAVAWAKTERGGKQMAMQFDEDEHTVCSARYGQCE